VNRGEVWWLEHPEAGRRPACVLTRQTAIPVLSQVLVAPATRTVRGIPTEVALGREDGMPDDCALSLDNIAAVPKGLLTRRITRLRPGKLAELCAALGIAVGC
jgi:mRNA interferase MazF